MPLGIILFLVKKVIKPAVMIWLKLYFIDRNYDLFQCWKDYKYFLNSLIKATGKQIRIVCNTMIFILVFCRIQIQEHRFLSICRNHKANKHCHWVWNWFLRSLDNQRKHLDTLFGLIRCLVVVVSCRIFCPVQSAPIHRLIITHTFISILCIYIEII